MSLKINNFRQKNLVTADFLIFLKRIKFRKIESINKLLRVKITLLT